MTDSGNPASLVLPLMCDNLPARFVCPQWDMIPPRPWNLVSPHAVSWGYFIPGGVAFCHLKTRAIVEDLASIHSLDTTSRNTELPGDQAPPPLHQQKWLCRVHSLRGAQSFVLGRTLKCKLGHPDGVNTWLVWNCVIWTGWCELGMLSFLETGMRKHLKEDLSHAWKTASLRLHKNLSDNSSEESQTSVCSHRSRGLTIPYLLTERTSLRRWLGSLPCWRRPCVHSEPHPRGHMCKVHTLQGGSRGVGAHLCTEIQDNTFREAHLCWIPGKQNFTKWEDDPKKKKQGVQRHRSTRGRLRGACHAVLHT